MSAMFLIRNFRVLLYLILAFFRYTEEITLTGGVQSPGRHIGYNSLSESETASPTEPTPAPFEKNEPYFDPTTPDNITGLVGKTSYLSCRVRSIGNKTVSWIRHRDIHILTVGSYTYTSDQRFQAVHNLEVDDWTLAIKWAQKRDAGIYECQISTQPVKSFFVTLNVVEEHELNSTDYQHMMLDGRVPTATILGGPDLHVQYGSTINLTCVLSNSPEPPAYIFWYHHDDVISYDSNRGGVTVITEKSTCSTSYLLIQNAKISDAGKYSCSPSNADVASVKVHILKGEHSEAMQTGSAGLPNVNIHALGLIVVMLVSNGHRLDSR